MISMHSRRLVSADHTIGVLGQREGLTKEPLSTVLEEAWPWREAAGLTLGLVAFFFATYIAAGWVTAQRSFVPSVAFAWERDIPFLPWTIVPYWTTDLFFLCAPFLFRTRFGLRTYCKRIVAVQLLSIAIFLVFPLQFSFGRPPVDGLFGEMFAIRTGMDTQCNQAPSLHIGLATVMWPAFRQHTRGWQWRILQVCFLAMSLSTLTTYRHHFIDLPTGLWAGLFSIALFPERDSTTQLRSGIILLYVAGAALFSFASYWAGTPGWLILWPAGLIVLWRKRLSSKHQESRSRLA